MANANAPRGLVPVRHYYGGEVRANAYAIASGLAANIFRGDLVKSTGTTKQITVAAAGNTCLGVLAGVQYINAAGDVIFAPYWPTGTTLQTGSACVALVYDDPNILFEVQGSASIVAADIGGVADMTAATSGSTATGVSGQQLDTTTIAASGSAQLKIVELVDRPDNAYGTNAKVHVLINEHELKAAMTAV